MCRVVIFQNFETKFLLRRGECKTQERICTFFEASGIRCRKTKSDVTKVTYNRYSCDKCCMSREMIKMESQDSAKCQKSKLRDMIGIIEFV